MSTHGSAALAEWTQQNAHPHRHACLACAQAKQRCDGTGLADCSNCAARGRVCTYRDPAPGESEAHSFNNDGPLDEFVDLNPLDNGARSATLIPQSDGDAVDSHGLLSGDSLQNPAMENMNLPTQQTTAAFPTPIHVETPANDFLSPSFAFPFSPIPQLGPDDVWDFFVGGSSLTALPTSMQQHNTYIASPPPSLDVRSVLEQESLTTEEDDILTAEYIPHVPQVGPETHARILRFVRNDLPSSEADALASTFPSLQHLDAYIQLYFEHYHPRMPLLHLPTFRPCPEAWQLVLAVACIGCQYSSAGEKSRHVGLLHRLARHMLSREVGLIVSGDPLMGMQSLLLFQHELWFAGDNAAIVHLQLYRNVLATLCRQLLSQEGTILRSQQSADDTSDPWLQWIQSESKRRVLYFAWITECLQSVFFMLPTLLSMHELHLPLPSHESHWQANQSQWQSLPPAQSPRSLCAVLAQIGIEGTLQEDVGPSAQLALLLSTSVQLNQTQNLERAMGIGIGQISADSTTPAAGSMADIQRRAFNTMSQLDFAEPLNPAKAATISSDYSIMVRIIRILDFTPLRTLCRATRWQTTEYGASEARRQLCDTFRENGKRANDCVFEASQLFQYFRTIKALSHIDTMCLLICVLYIYVYIELGLRSSSSTIPQQDGARPSRIIRLDQPDPDDEREDWLSGRHDCQPHLAGIGLLDAERSSARLFKEASRIMANSATTSRLAMALSSIMNTHAVGGIPKFQEDQ
ncbi:hypothetical protein CB0940_06698 [Cercospora beticola]|uniref:Zn(2)-C6 fungal-type domain-containing protein n=1 Tax=Cercospora beticola TaxID=122368 RepID=A0A2G5HXY8_CERBT|nr:hypothetical protein CB0940_06698 [Cercospora beticola]PIA97417.1 hypothetical protein CB0940_06698 [Cercospora beticola]WPA99373.1 hypothetical protein RHO25_003990 [Cercospora beticola]